MKKLIYFLFAFFFSVQLMAQASFGLKLSGGMGFPMGPSDFKDYYKTGFNGGAGLTIDILGMVAVEAEAEYHSFPLNSDKFQNLLGVSGMGIDISGGGISVLSLMANARLNLGPAISPISFYILAGLGTANIKSEEFKVSAQGSSQTIPSHSESKLSYQGGAGVQFGLGSYAIFAEVKYVSISTEDKTIFVPVKAGIKFKL